MKSLILCLLFFLPLCVSAQIVDTWQFASPEQQKQAYDLARELRCPQCQNQNLMESNAPVAVTMRHEVFTLVEQGKSADEIVASMTQRYGEFVRYTPSLTRHTLLLWGAPLLLVGMAGGGWWLAMRRQRRAWRQEAEK
ncbi:heme lyase NrfEFG subunit NrfF [Enterobacillus tribolii]|uniref:Formate-dependent nitrite reductase complex subunit n=1 Tax=Enterobacillus tribolii TaxID=1487935 RepID=A0A370QN98_9GAMM|nr:heme lyase NrfEFG subunit NrfF [Enterobacillus tribolii]RDK89843.1 respiratory nitrite reductase-specific cytochrome c biogenesis protein NrfF [Enterobacillus tribolii]